MVGLMSNLGGVTHEYDRAVSGRVEERGGEKEGHIPEIIVINKEFTKQTQGGKFGRRVKSKIMWK